MTRQSSRLVRGSAAARWCAAVALLVGPFVSSTAFAVALRVVSPPPVRQSGDTASVCVELDSAGDTVVGTENELVWSNSCASIVGECAGDNVRAAPMRNPGAGNDGVKVIVLNMSGLTPIPDGLLYCCNLRVHPEPGSCCSISIQNAGSSDSKANRLPTVGHSGQACVASAPAAGGRLERGFREPPPVVGADLGTGPPEPVGEAGPRPGGPIGGAPRPPVAVMPGGEPLAEVPPVELAAEPATAPEAEPTAPAEPAEPSVLPTPVPTAARTAAPEAATTPAPETPTLAPRSPVQAPTRAAETKRAAEATPERRSGCQCQIGATSDDWSGLVLLLGAAGLLGARRRHSRSRI